MWRLISLTLAAAILVTSATAALMARPEDLNQSTGVGTHGILWPDAADEADEGDLIPGTEDELHGGFSSLEGMLQWAIGHSDPAKLKETAKEVRKLSPEELKGRQIELQEFMEKHKLPSDAKLMQIAIDDLKNSSMSLEDRFRALYELLELVEPIDNANDLHKLGGLTVVIGELYHSATEVRALAAEVLGKASQNNPRVQKQVLELGAMAILVKMAKSCSVEEVTKALYAISALVRNNLDGQELFYQEAGYSMLQDILNNSTLDIRLHRKSVSLIADLAECQLGSENREELPIFSNRFFLKSVVDLVLSSDLDLQEKALYAIRNLLLLRSTEGLVFKDFCKLDLLLERMRQQLQQLMVDENHREYAMDVESLRQEVQQTFIQKLDKQATQVPT
nr:nucleotide exchange factor SIL1 isoform X1 [Ipomoea trifida]